MKQLTWISNPQSYTSVLHSASDSPVQTIVGLGSYIRHDRKNTDRSMVNEYDATRHNDMYYISVPASSVSHSTWTFFSQAGECSSLVLLLYPFKEAVLELSSSCWWGSTVLLWRERRTVFGGSLTSPSSSCLTPLTLFQLLLQPFVRFVSPFIPVKRCASVCRVSVWRNRKHTRTHISCIWQRNTACIL